MKKSLAILAVAIALPVVAGQAYASTSHVTSAKAVMVVMKDPGCHWFSVNGKFSTTLSVKGPVALSNFDEAALRIAGPSGVRTDGVGQKLVLAHGVYKITMVGQAPDDNHLKLTVR
jgi:hypothetical protein